MSAQNRFIYGTHYWRPPSAASGRHRYHLERVKHEMGFDLIKFRMGWNWHHREPDRFTFDEVHEIFDICDEIGLQVMLELSLEQAPYWLEYEHPETRYVNANGRAIELGSQEATPGGGHPGLCLHHGVVMQHAERYTRQMVREFQDRESLWLYDCWNEPHLEPVWCNNMWGNLGDKVYCYCEGSRAAFRKWLERRYGDIEAFNKAWGRAYSRFEHVNPPILNGNYADWLDWIRFWLEELQEHMRWRVKVIKEEDPSRMVISHSGAVPPVLPRAHACIDNWRFAEPVDMWGTSFAPQAFSWDLSTCAEVIEATRGAARGKPFWVSEMPGGAGNIRGFKASRIPRPKDYHVWNWLAAALGSLGTMHWCYLTEWTGQEAGNFGMLRLNAQHTPRSREIAATAARLKKHQDILVSAEVPTQVAVLYDPDNSSLLFAMELADKLYGDSHVGYYRSIWKSDLIARYVTYDTMEDIREKVLIVPMALTMSDHVAERIAQFVHDGGVLIADVRTGVYNERGYMRPELPAGRLSKAAGLVEGEQIYSDPGNVVTVPTADGTVESEIRSDLPALDPIQVGPPMTFTWPIEAQVRVQQYLAPLELRGAEPIAKYGDLVLAAHHRYGKGEVYYFGTYMGLALEKNVPDALALLQEILLRHAEPVVRGDRLRPRLIDGGEEGTLLVVFNDHRTDTISEEVRLPDGAQRAKDIVTGQEYAASDGQVRLTVGAEDAVVLLLDGSS